MEPSSLPKTQMLMLTQNQLAHKMCLSPFLSMVKKDTAMELNFLNKVIYEKLSPADIKR
jgi:hypothetical protein